MLGNLFNKGKCLVGFHEGEWRYDRPGDCTQAQVCERCRARNSRIEHQWPEWRYRSEDACDLIRVCTRCSETESRVEHAWGEPGYRYSDSCVQVQTCARCQDEREAGTRHQFERWEYENEDDCTQVQVCVRCGEHGRRGQVQHLFGESQYSPFYDASVIVCRHCAEMYVDDGRQQRGEPLVSMQQVDAAVTSVLSSGDWEGIRLRLHRNRSVLFSPAADSYFKFAFDQYPQDDETQRQFVQMQALLDRCKQSGIDAVIQEIVGPTVEAPPTYRTPTSYQDAPAPSASRSAPAPSGPGRGIDNRLVGNWRHTETMMSGDFSMATDTHFYLGADGRFRRFSESAGSMGSSSTPYEYGSWWVQNGTLYLQFDGGYTSSHEYEVYSDSLYLPNERQRLWERV